jgi:hypothetical protein
MKNYILKISAVALSAIVATGCLDDDKYALDPSTTKNVIEFTDPNVPVSPAGSIYSAWLRAFPVDQGDQVFEQEISFSGPNSNSSAINLEVEVDVFALEQYNLHQEIGLFGGDPLEGKSYELLPASHYAIEDLSITIPKGSTKGYLTITVHPTMFDLTKSYALPLRIKTTSKGVLSAHFSAGIFPVVIKNKFDWAFETKVGQQGWGGFGLQDGGPLLTYPSPGMGFATTGPNTNQCANLAAGTNLIPAFDAAGGATQYGAASPVWTFNLTPASVVGSHEYYTVTLMDNATPDARNRDFALDPAALATENLFDLNTALGDTDKGKAKIRCRFLMTQNGRPTNFYILDLTSTGPRP